MRKRKILVNKKTLLRCCRIELDKDKIMTIMRGDTLIYKYKGFDIWISRAKFL